MKATELGAHELGSVVQTCSTNATATQDQVATMIVQL